MKKSIKRLFSLVLAMLMLLGLCACGKKNVISGDQALEVYLWDAGYGTAWLETALEAFAQEDWVKEKYPNLQYKLVTNDQSGYAEGRIGAGSANSIDLFFASSLQGTFKTLTVDLTEKLFNSKVPGEDVLYKDKMQPYILDALNYKDELGQKTDRFYGTGYGDGMTGFIYNRTLFEKLGLELPRTTDELVALCQKVKDMDGKNPAYPHTYSIISSKIAYSDRLVDVWWAQYDTAEGVSNYYNAIAPDGTRNSVDIFNEKGRLETAKIYESLYKKDAGYFDRSSYNYEFIQGQTRMLIGEGLLMVCGEWFSTEMRDLANEYIERGYDYDIGMMNVPVVSAIIDKTPTIKDDAMLSQVIADIDAGLTAPSDSSVSAEDYAIVMAARGVHTTRDALSSTAVIAKESDAVEIAIDFLRYMATDEALSIYAEKTYGGLMPFDYELKKDNPELHEKLTKEYGKTYEVLQNVSDILHKPYSSGVSYVSPMITYSAFTAFTSPNMEGKFMADDSLTAEAYIADHDSYWLANNAANFQKALARAGLS